MHALVRLLPAVQALPLIEHVWREILRHQEMALRHIACRMIQRNARLPNDKDKTERKAAEGQGRNGSKGSRATGMKRIKRLPNDKDTTERKAAEGQGRNGSKGCRATTIQMNERLSSSIKPPLST
jgi:hypothetical protein